MDALKSNSRLAQFSTQDRKKGLLLNGPLVLGNELVYMIVAGVEANNPKLNICDEISIKDHKSLNLETTFKLCNIFIHPDRVYLYLNFE